MTLPKAEPHLCIDLSDFEEQAGKETQHPAVVGGLRGTQSSVINGEVVSWR